MTYHAPAGPMNVHKSGEAKPGADVEGAAWDAAEFADLNIDAAKAHAAEGRYDLAILILHRVGAELRRYVRDPRTGQSLPEVVRIFNKLKQALREIVAQRRATIAAGGSWSPLPQNWDPLWKGKGSKIGTAWPVQPPPSADEDSKVRRDDADTIPEVGAPVMPTGAWKKTKEEIEEEASRAAAEARAAEARRRGDEAAARREEAAREAKRIADAPYWPGPLFPLIPPAPVLGKPVPQVWWDAYDAFWRSIWPYSGGGWVPPFEPHGPIPGIPEGPTSPLPGEPASFEPDPGAVNIGGGGLRGLPAGSGIRYQVTVPFPSQDGSAVDTELMNHGGPSLFSDEVSDSFAIDGNSPPVDA